MFERVHMLHLLGFWKCPTYSTFFHDLIFLSAIVIRMYELTFFLQGTEKERSLQLVLDIRGIDICGFEYSRHPSFLVGSNQSLLVSLILLVK